MTFARARCPYTGKLIVTANNPVWCDVEGWIYPWHLTDAGPMCPYTTKEQSDEQKWSKGGYD